jgi:hypothetical protein
MSLEANNLTEYLEKIKEVYLQLYPRAVSKEFGDNFDNGLFFRGQSNYKHGLIPGVLRTEEDIKAEKTLLFNFRDYMPQHNLSFDFINERIEILSWMQHYRIPTRLLDWSFSPLISLYFACGSEKNDGAVFVFNPWLYTGDQVFKGRPKTDHHSAHIYARSLMSDRLDNPNGILKIVKRKYDVDLEKDSLRMPFPFVSSFNNQRILHQKGCFTIQGTVNDDFEKQLEHSKQKYISKIIIKNTSLIKKELSLLFINEYSVYPDFEGMAKQLKADKSLYKVHF